MRDSEHHDGLGEVLAEALCEEYADADLVDLDDAVDDMLESLSPAEAFNLGKALNQIGRTARQITADPAFAQVAGAVLPVAGGAAGTVLGGPLGTALGAQLGAAAARSLPTRARPHRHAAGPAPAPAAGSAAATRALVLTQHPDVLKALLALAVGEHGRREVGGVPVAALMSMLGQVFGKAAEDADELAYLDAGEAAGDLWVDEEAWADDDTLYRSLLDADDEQIAEAVGWR